MSTWAARARLRQHELRPFAQAVCLQAPCSADTLTQANTTIRQGCAAEISQGSLALTVVDRILSRYNDSRAALCAKSTSDNAFCVPTLLKAVETGTNTTLSRSFVVNLAQGGLAALRKFGASIPKAAYCTDARRHSLCVPICSRCAQCGHAVTTLVSRVTADDAAKANGTIVSRIVSGQCGATFADGAVPATVSTGA
jgi:hypothetical protein